ncbi:MAG: glycoside hydrolase [Bacteroidota bacterium]
MLHFRITLLIIGLWSCVCTTTVAAQSGNSRIVDVNAAQTGSILDRNFARCVGAGRANEGLRADWQRQLTMAKRECGFEYIRFHGLLADDMGVYKEDKNGVPQYNWQYIDELYDFLLRIKVRPFVEIGFMPNALASGRATVFWWRGNITPPKDYQKWNQLISKLIEHWTERYGRDEVRRWYFEVWNEPNLRNLFFFGSQSDYFKMYQETANTIKKVDSRYRVGGPASAGNAWITDLIDFCAEKSVPIDFISTHDYGVKQGFLDVSGTVGTIVNPDKNSVSNNMRRSFQEIRRSKKPDLELHYTEWSSSYTPTDPLHDTYQEASYILNTVKRAAHVVNSLSYWTFTDIFEEQGPKMTPFHGGFGLLNYQDIKKPAYYAYSYLNQLAKYELPASDSSSIVTKDAQGNIAALFWDCTIDHPGDSTNDQVYYKKNLPARPSGQLKIQVRGLKPGKYQLEVHRTGYRVNDAYSAYMALQSPSQLTITDVAAINRNNADAPVLNGTVRIDANRTFERTFQLQQNDVYFLKLRRL